ncbi:MAG: HspR, transcriptional repressor of DnaK operon, partial [uncultured Pseudonocardia sp.]
DVAGSGSVGRRGLPRCRHGAGGGAARGAARVPAQPRRGRRRAARAVRGRAPPLLPPPARARGARPRPLRRGHGPRRGSADRRPGGPAGHRPGPGRRAGGATGRRRAAGFL